MRTLAFAVFAAFASTASMAQSTVGISGFKVLGPNPLDESTTQALLAPFTGNYADDNEALAKLQAAAQALEKRFQDSGNGFLRVALPPQQASNVVTLQIVRFTLGKVEVTGNKFFDEANIRASLPSLVTGSTPNLHEVARELALANESTVKRATLGFEEGGAAETVDLKIKVEDERPWSAAIALNNTGTRDSGRSRVMLSVSHSNLMGGDEALAASLVRSPERSDVRQYGLQFKKPIYALASTFAAYVSHSTSGSAALGTGLDITGSGTTKGASWTWSMLPVDTLKQQWTVSLDDRLFRGSVLSSGAQISPDVRSRPVTVSYSARWDGETSIAQLQIDLANNLGGGSGNDAASYAANRQGAKRNWNAIRINGDLLMALPDQWQFSGKLRAQFADQPLISGEQFGIGGASMLRGFNERAVTGDSGIGLGVEFTRPLVTGLKGAIFLDAASLHRVDAAVGTASNEAPVSAGIGIRYSIDKLSLVVDYGRVLRGTKLPVVATGSDQLHATVVYRF
jgi:hemolysin activation/secretion protein